MRRRDDGDATRVLLLVAFTHKDRGHVGRMIRRDSAQKLNSGAPVQRKMFQSEVQVRVKPQTYNRTAHGTERKSPCIPSAPSQSISPRSPRLFPRRPCPVDDAVARWVGDAIVTHRRLYYRWWGGSPASRLLQASGVARVTQAWSQVRLVVTLWIELTEVDELQGRSNEEHKSRKTQEPEQI